MGMDEKVAVIVNPMSANGRTGENWKLLEPHVKELLGDYELLVTEHSGHGVELTRRALKSGIRRIISVGGDGTHHEVLNGFFEAQSPISPDASMAILPQGTGSDLARTLGMPSGPEAIPHLVSDKLVSADVGWVVYALPEGGEATRYFMNVAHVGFGGAVAERVNRHSKAFGGFFSFLWGVAKTILTYENVWLRVEVDGEKLEGIVSDVIIANAKYEGGGMLIAPEAELDSGTFEVFIIGDIRPVQALMNIPRLYRGTLNKRPDMVKHFKARRVVVRARERVLLNLEGEQPGEAPVAFQIIPGAINLVVPNRPEP